MTQSIKVIRGDRELVGMNFKTFSALTKELMNKEEVVVLEMQGTKETGNNIAVGYRKITMSEIGEVVISRPSETDEFDLSEQKVDFNQCLIKARNELGNFNPQAVARAHEIMAFATL